MVKRISCLLVLSMAAAQLVSMSAQAAPLGALLTPGKLAGTVKIAGSMIPGTNLPEVGTLGNLSVNGALKALPPVILVKHLRVPPALGNVTVSEALVRVEDQRISQTSITGLGTLNAALAPVAVTVIKFESKIP